MGAKSWREVLAIRWRISTTEAGRRLDEAAHLGHAASLTGEPLEPVLPCTALAQAHGLINREHVQGCARGDGAHPAGGRRRSPAIRSKPTWSRTAIGVGPKELKDNADRTLFLLDQDGPEPDDTERARRRGVTNGAAGPDGMTPLKANLTPQRGPSTRRSSPSGPHPGCATPTTSTRASRGPRSQEQIDDDHRSLAQRQHDALIAVGRSVLDSGELGQHNGLPTSIIIRTTLQDLESRAGIGVTGGGTVIPISDVIRMAAHANHYLAVFDKATGSALDLFRGPPRRLTGAADHAHRPRRGLHQTRLHGARLRQPGPPRRPRLGRRRTDQRRRTGSGVRT